MREVSLEARRNLSEKAKIRFQNEENKAYLYAYWKPFCTEAELREDYEVRMMSQVQIGEKYGVSAHRVATSMKRHGIKTRPAVPLHPTRGSSSGTWKGDDVGLQALHCRVEALYGKPNTCEVCGKTEPGRRHEWANLTGNYHDVNDYKRMCLFCHRRYDAGRRREKQAEEDLAYVKARATENGVTRCEDCERPIPDGEEVIHRFTGERGVEEGKRRHLRCLGRPCHDYRNLHYGQPIKGKARDKLTGLCVKT